MKSQKRLIAEFQMQTFTQIIFPHEATDWKEYLHEAQETFLNIINAIRKHQKCLIICHDINAVKEHFKDESNLAFVAYTTNDTWARDCSPLTIEENENRTLLDFTFNGWGGKFDAQKDNLLSSTIAQNYPYPMKTIDFVLEGGAIESNGVDTILTTSSCMLNENRNPHLNAVQITQKLKDLFGAQHILYLNHGYLAGDDTDSHIDTLARFISQDTIMYVQCTDKTDEHYHELKSMEEELQMTAKEKNLKLIPLPMPDAIYYEQERLPATYANFLFINDAILLPLYNVPQDTIALTLFKKTFPKREIIALDASVLIRQHGSIHCVTMNF